MLAEFYNLLLQSESSSEDIKELRERGLRECASEFEPLIKLIDTFRTVPSVNKEDQSESNSEKAENDGSDSSSSPGETNPNDNNQVSLPLLNLPIFEEECADMLTQFHHLLSQPDRFDELKDLCSKIMQDCENDFKPLKNVIDAIVGKKAGSVSIIKKVVKERKEKNDVLEDNNKTVLNSATTPADSTNTTSNENNNNKLVGVEDEEDEDIDEAAVQLKDARLNAVRKLFDEFRAFLSTHDPKSKSLTKDTSIFYTAALRDSFTDLLNCQLFPQNIPWKKFVMLFLSEEFMRAFLLQDKVMFQRLYEVYEVERGECELSLPFVLYSDFDIMQDWKFWGAVKTSNWELAKSALKSNKVASFPKYVCDVLLDDLYGGDLSRISLLSNLDIEKVVVLWDILLQDNERDDRRVHYASFKFDEEKRQKYAEEYKNIVKQMKLLMADIHPDFHFDIPELLTTNSFMEDIEGRYMRKAKPKLAEAFETLKGDKAYSFTNIFNVINNIPSPVVKLELLVKFIEFKRSKIYNNPPQKLDYKLLEITKLVFEKDQEALSKKISKFCKFIVDKGFSLSTLEDALHNLRQVKGISTVNSELLHFWEELVNQLKSFRAADKPLGKILRICTPIHITRIGEAGLRGLMDLSLHYFQLQVKIAQYLNANDNWNRLIEFTKAYIELYDLWKGEDMEGLFNVEKIKTIDKSILARLIKNIPDNFLNTHAKILKDSIPFVNVDLKNSLLARFKGLKVDWVGSVDQSVTKLLQNPKLTADKLENSLDALAILILIKNLDKRPYNDPRLSKPSKDPQVEDLRAQFATNVAPNRLLVNEAFSDLENDCKEYLLKRENLILKEEVTRLGL